LPSSDFDGLADENEKENSKALATQIFNTAKVGVIDLTCVK